MKKAGKKATTNAGAIVQESVPRHLGKERLISTRLGVYKSVRRCLGNKVCGIWPYVTVLVIDALAHVGLMVFTATSPYDIVRLIISFVFFIYPLYFIADVLWSLRPSVAAILAGEVKVNRKHYANVVRSDVPTELLPSVTVSIAVYKEENPVVFETIRQALRAAERYRKHCNKPANVVVSDDGLAALLGGDCSRTKVEQLLACHAQAPHVLQADEVTAAERILFYRKKGIGFVARPAQGRAGKFKKASNLNYTLRLGERCVQYATLPAGVQHATLLADCSKTASAVALPTGCNKATSSAALPAGCNKATSPTVLPAGSNKAASSAALPANSGKAASPATGDEQLSIVPFNSSNSVPLALWNKLFQPGGEFEQGYAEGDIETHEIILLLDKDSGVHERIIEAVAPEFIADPNLAYAQCATNAHNYTENYYTRAFGYQLNNLSHNIWPSKALQGYFVPLVGHNVFLRKSHLMESGFWSENKVSEDFDKAIGFYNRGFHGKYMQLAGLEFTEYVSRTFAEETGKQFRYCYGLIEMIFQGTIQPGKTRGCDQFYMVLYFCSLINAVMLFPTALFECYFGDVYLLWAGFTFCMLFYIILPCLRCFFMRKRLPKEQLAHIGQTIILALSFLGHAYSMLAGLCKFFADKLKRNPKPFPATNVDELEVRFVDGLRLVGEYYRKNKGCLVITALCIERCIFLWTQGGVDLPTLCTYSYIFLASALVPVLLTPQLYIQAHRALRGSKPKALLMSGTKQDMPEVLRKKSV